MTISAEKVANVYEYVYVRIYMYISRYMCICSCIYFICIYNLLMKHINETTMTDCTVAIAQKASFKVQPTVIQCKLELWEKSLWKNKY